MARSSGTDPTSLLAVGVIGFAAYQYAMSRGWRPPAAVVSAVRPPNTPPTPVASGTVNPVPATVPLTVVQQYNEQRDDGWYQVTQWSDGHFDSTFIPPVAYPNYNIPTVGLGRFGQ